MGTIVGAATGPKVIMFVSKLILLEKLCAAIDPPFKLGLTTCEAVTLP